MWIIRRIILKFQRFVTPYTGDAFFELLKDVLMKWNLMNGVQSETNDNASDIILGVAKLCNLYRSLLHPAIRV